MSHTRNAQGLSETCNSGWQPTNQITGRDCSRSKSHCRRLLPDRTRRKEKDFIISFSPSASPSSFLNINASLFCFPHPSLFWPSETQVLPCSGSATSGSPLAFGPLSLPFFTGTKTSHAALSTNRANRPGLAPSPTTSSRTFDPEFFVIWSIIRWPEAQRHHLRCWRIRAKLLLCLTSQRQL